MRVPAALAASVALALLSMSPAVAGTRWAVQRTPNPATGGRVPATPLSGVSCSSPRACTAVGIHVGVKTDTPVAERWNGTAWRLQHVPGHGTGSDDLTVESVSCPAARFCMAVGSLGKGRATVYRWNGSRWTFGRAAGPRGADLFAVACSGPRACIAVGQYDTSSLTTAPFADRWNGTSWSLQRTWKLIGGLNGICCPSASDCIATGGYHVASTGDDFPLAVRWNGRAWATQRVPVPAGVRNAALGGVSCASASRCLTVGVTVAAVIGARWDGTRWSLLPPPPGAAGSVLQELSCIRHGACVSVGFRNNASGNEQVLAQSWDGTRWTTEATPSPSAQYSVFDSVSCPAAGYCVAVGAYQLGRSQFHQVSLAERRT